MSTIRRISDRAIVSVAGEATDPCQVIAGPSASAGDQHDIEVEIDARVVLHELQQCEVDVTQDTLRDFVATDARSEQGRDAYITFARFIIGPVAPLSGVHHAITPRWIWTETTAVVVDDGLVKFRGRCVPA
jgi:hypothetical protein